MGSSTRKTRKTTRSKPATAKSAPKRTRSVKRARQTVAPMTLTAPAAPSHDEIARLAFQLWVRRGQVDGYAREDWLIAEAELLNGLPLPLR